MSDPHGENPGAVSFLHGDDKSNHLANGVDSDGGELCSVTLIHIDSSHHQICGPSADVSNGHGWDSSQIA